IRWRRPVRIVHARASIPVASIPVAGIPVAQGSRVQRSLAVNCRRCLLLATAIACLGSPVLAQSSATKSQTSEPTAEEVEEARKKRLMPKPLEAIESNIRDLEKQGFLSIVSGSYKIINNAQDDAIVWTVRANKALTCRHIVMQIESLSDVRLYKTLNADAKEPSLQEVHSMKLYYSSFLDERASSSSLFARDDIFRIWVYLDPVEVRKIRSLSADRAVFRASKRR
ncbi:MAG: hypothetical protein QGH33_14075, partial [Pirellulaceae bacterium]|nr:hypothetical protein [Pirellulaceae bacterium]